MRRDYRGRAGPRGEAIGDLEPTGGRRTDSRTLPGHPVGAQTHRCAPARDLARNAAGRHGRVAGGLGTKVFPLSEQAAVAWMARRVGADAHSITPRAAPHARRLPALARARLRIRAGARPRRARLALRSRE